MKRLMKANKEKGEIIPNDPERTTMTVSQALKRLDVLYIEMKTAIENANKTVSDVQGKHDELSQIIPALRKITAKPKSNATEKPQEKVPEKEEKKNAIEEKNAIEMKIVRFFFFVVVCVNFFLSVFV